MRHALIAGGGGVIGRALVEHFSRLGGWKVTTISRRPLTYETSATWLRADLIDPDSCKAQLGGLTDVTHIFYAAYQDARTLVDLVAPNRAMLVNLLEAVCPTARGLNRVFLFTGGKVYGSVLGPYKTPAKETDARHMPPNFYYDQEDALRERQAGQSWQWTVLRPAHICGIATGNPMNICMAVAVYATLSRELGLPMRFPGKETAYERLTQFAEATQLARAATWACDAPASGNQVFNCTNGDFARWKDLWPVFADYFGMKYARPQRISLQDHMSDKGALWKSIAQRHGLQDIAWQDLVGWRYADGVFNRFEWDFMSSTTKIRQAGFHYVVDSESMFLRIFDDLRRQRIIP